MSGKCHKYFGFPAIEQNIYVPHQYQSIFLLFADNQNFAYVRMVIFCEEKLCEEMIYANNCCLLHGIDTKNSQ